MNPDLVEKVAVAIHGETRGDQVWDRLSPLAQRYYRILARAAIAAVADFIRGDNVAP